jgi:hypothetical protein
MQELLAQLQAESEQGWAKLTETYPIGDYSAEALNAYEKLRCLDISIDHLKEYINF